MTVNLEHLLTDLKSCEDLQWGKMLHAKASELKIDSDKYVVNTLIKIYCKCSNTGDARALFDNTHQPNVVHWNTLMFGYVANGQHHDALDLFFVMKELGTLPDSFTFVAVLKACTKLAVNGNGSIDFLEIARNIRSEFSCISNPYVQNTLIDMYCKCGRMVEARSVFDSMKKPNIVSWNALLTGYAENGNHHAALDMFSNMKMAALPPDSFTYVAVLKACIHLAVNGDECDKMKSFQLGRRIHSEINCNLDIFLKSTLIDMYSKCGYMQEACGVFDTIQKPNVVSWTTLILGYAENGHGYKALDLFSKMKASGCVPDSVTYIAALKACTSLALNGNTSECLKLGKDIHLEIGGHLNTYIQGTLIDMFAKCGCMAEAHRIFDSMEKPNIVAWNALLLGYANNGEGKLALDLQWKMKECGCSANSVTYVSLFKACTSLAVSRDAGEKRYWLKRGRQLHSEVGSHLDSYVQGTLIDMYANCGSMAEAHEVFATIENPDVVSWNSLLLGYVMNGSGDIALGLFFEMKNSGYAPDSVTYIAALKACTSLAVKADWSRKEGCLQLGRAIHSEVGCHEHHLNLQGALIDMYSKCGSMIDAHCVFEGILNPSTVSCNILLLGYIENGEAYIALKVLSKIKASGFVMDSMSYIAALKACGRVGALALGRKLHSDITEFTPQLITCLVDFYAKCGSLIEAREVFEYHSSTRDITTWTALLAGYGRFGDFQTVFKLFQEMQDKGLRPDGITFLCVLLCCSHAGLIGRAREFFEGMEKQYGVTPTLMHYTCMVDVLGRGNELHEAFGMIRNMPYQPSVVIWMTLLNACRKWKDVAMGKEALTALANMENENASTYVLMARVCEEQGVEFTRGIYSNY